MRTMFNRVATLIIPSNTLQHQPITKQVDGVEARDSINCEVCDLRPAYVLIRLLLFICSSSTKKSQLGRIDIVSG